MLIILIFIILMLLIILIILMVLYIAGLRSYLNIGRKYLRIYNTKEYFMLLNKTGGRPPVLHAWIYLSHNPKLK